MNNSYDLSKKNQKNLIKIRSLHGLLEELNQELKKDNKISNELLLQIEMKITLLGDDIFYSIFIDVVDHSDGQIEKLQQVLEQKLTTENAPPKLLLEWLYSCEFPAGANIKDPLTPDVLFKLGNSIQNIEDAIGYYATAAEQGHLEAMRVLSHIYHTCPDYMDQTKSLYWANKITAVQSIHKALEPKYEFKSTQFQRANLDDDTINLLERVNELARENGLI